MNNPLPFDPALYNRRLPEGLAEKIVTVTPMDRDEYIAMKMLTRFKELKREDPKKPHPDIGWMLELLEVVRHYEKSSDASTLE